MKPRNRASQTRAGASDLPPGRKRLFSVLAALVIPLLLLSLETALRLGGYGYPAPFFVEREVQGEELLTENPKFGFRFFPPGMARSPTPMAFPREKSNGTFRIFLLGESAALGDPRPAYGFGRYLEVLLNEKFPETRFEVICAAMTAINSHALLPVAKECAALDGDLWIVYMGNNEMIGPFGATGQLGAKTPALWQVRATLAIKQWRVGQLIDAAVRRLSGGSGKRTWRGLDLFTGHEIPPASQARKQVQANFRANLEDIIGVAADAGVETVVCTVASNLKDCAPHASMHSTDFRPGLAKAWEASYHAGIAALQAGNYSEAVPHFEKARELDPQFAELRYRLGICRLGQTNHAAASEEFRAARDLDGLPFRTTTALNEIIRETVAEASETVTLLDVENRLGDPTGEAVIPGNGLFLDHVHYNFEGNYRVALDLAQQVAKALPEETTRSAKTSWIDQGECERRLGLTEWNKFLAYETMLGRLAGPPYTKQISNPETRQAHRESMAALRTAAGEVGAEKTREIYNEAISSHPRDHYRHQSYAEYLEMSGDLNGAIEEWRTIQTLVPHHPLAYFHAGRLWVRQGDFVKAQAELERGLAIRGDFPEALLELGKALAGQGKQKAAQARFQDVLEMEPGNAVAHFQMAESLAAQDQREAAMEHLRAAVTANPGYWQAHYYLGVELALQQKVDEAAHHFSLVVRLKPDHALAHYNYGVALAQQRRYVEARIQFAETLKLEPDHTGAQKHLGTLNEVLRQK